MSAAALLLVALLAQAAAPGQTTRTPPRDPRAATTQPGTGVIRGIVVDPTSAAPVKRATVRLFGSAFRENSPSTVTDDEGRFEFRNLPAGKYNVTTTKPGFISGSFAKPPSNEPGLAIELLEDQIAEKIVLRLARGGVVVGRVMDEGGEPVIGVELRALQYRYGPNGRTLAWVAGGFIRTDDLGAFRLYGLSPGQYYISARPDPHFSSSGPAIAADTGTITTFFPSSADAATAQRVTVAAGRETGPIIITLVSTKLSRARGRALMSNGQPLAQATVLATSRDDDRMGANADARTNAEGSFEVRGLTPGTYELLVRQQTFSRDDDVEIARQTITVAGDDIDGLVLIGTKPGIARGRVITDDGTPMAQSEMSIMATAPGGAMRFDSPPAMVKSDFTFELRGLFGQRLFRLGGVAPSSPDATPWMLKAVMLNGIDIIDKPLDIQPDAVIEGLEMVFTRKAAELTGTVTVSGGARLEDANIILFPADESLWRDIRRFIRITRPDKAGTYKFALLPAHSDYLLVTALELEPGQHMDPDFLRSVRDRAMRLSLDYGEKKVQDIRIAAFGQ